MTKLKVCRDGFSFAGRKMARGEHVDSQEFPHIDRYKWAQLIDQRFFDLVDTPGADLSRAMAERDRARINVDAPAVVDVPGIDVVETKPARTCPGCGGPLRKKNPNGPGRYPKLCPACKAKE